MIQLLALAVLLPNDTEALRNQRESTAQCPLSTGGAHLRSAHNRHDRRYFVVFTRPHSGADFLCKLLNRHPEITCAGELSNPNPNHNPNQSRSELFNPGLKSSPAQVISGWRLSSLHRKSAPLCGRVNTTKYRRSCRLCALRRCAPASDAMTGGAA